MCGRFTYKRPFREIHDLYEITNVPGGIESNYPPNYNVAPTDPELIVREREGVRELVEMRWGLVPYWSKDKRGAFKCINARAETVETNDRD